MGGIRPTVAVPGFHGMFKNFAIKRSLACWFLTVEKCHLKMFQISFWAYFINFFIHDAFLKSQSTSLNVAFSTILP